MNCERIQRCRVSGSMNLVLVLDLGEQALTGVFPRAGKTAPAGPVELVFCPDSGLLQLAHHYDQAELYGQNYGYRSGLNASMVGHLRAKAARLWERRPLHPGEVVIDIGSNDGTLLGCWPESARRIGYDPSGEKFRHFYPEGVELRPDFFQGCGERAAIITSIAMFYDLPDPRKFVRAVAAALAPDGIWHFEQSYLPAMLRTGAYDTVVAEHLEYYSLAVVERLLVEAGLRVIDVEINGINGGSFAVTAAPLGSGRPVNEPVIRWMLEEERRMGLQTRQIYEQFATRALEHRESLVSLMERLRADGRTIVGCGASTKGNCLLQFCGLDDDFIAAIGDVNVEKHGACTPGTGIPIVSEEEMRAMKPDYMLVPVWHFRAGIIQREAEFLSRGGKLIFPFPYVDIVG